MFHIFTANSPYKKTARFLAMLWTLLILIGCFTPGKELPKVDVPLIDKWVHIVLFAGFSFFWYCSFPKPTLFRYVALIVIASFFGSLIEILQGLLTFLGRSMEFMDALADTIGGILGIGMCMLGVHFFNKI